MSRARLQRGRQARAGGGAWASWGTWQGPDLARLWAPEGHTCRAVGAHWPSRLSTAGRTQTRRSRRFRPLRTFCAASDPALSSVAGAPAPWGFLFTHPRGQPRPGSAASSPQELSDSICSLAGPGRLGGGFAAGGLVCGWGAGLRLGGRSAAGGQVCSSPAGCPHGPPPRPYVPPALSGPRCWAVAPAGSCLSRTPRGSGGGGRRLSRAARSCNELPTVLALRPEPGPVPLRGGPGVVSPCSRAEWQLEFSGLDPGGPAHISRACLWFGSRVVTPPSRSQEAPRRGPELGGAPQGLGLGRCREGHCKDSLAAKRLPLVCE